MPATTTQRPTTSSLLVTATVFLGLAAFSLAPLSCGTDGDETTSNGASATQSQSNTDREILLHIGIEDETGNRPISDAFVLKTPRGARWSPGILDGAGATKAFEKYPVGQTRTLRLYPEGQDGDPLEVPITMKPDMSSVLASSRTDIFVYDDSIVVSGPAVPDEKVAFERK